MAQLSNLPIELWKLIFNDEILIPYSHLLSFICKKTHNICIKHKNKNILDIACKDGYFNIIEWAYKKGYRITQKSFKNAAFRGNLEILKWLRSKEYKWNTNTCAAAAEGGHFEVLLTH